MLYHILALQLLYCLMMISKNNNVQVLNKMGYSKGDDLFDEYMELVDTAKYKIEKFIKRWPTPSAIIALRNDLMKKYFQFDVREHDSEIYSSDVVLLAVIWSSLCGGKTCKDHAWFYFENNSWCSI